MGRPRKTDEEKKASQAIRYARWKAKNPDRCKAQKRAAYYRRKEKHIESNRAWKKANREKVNSIAKKSHNNKADSIATRPIPEVCEVCSKPETVTRGGKLRRLCFDHCHDTGKFRGWLCVGCNTAIGYAKDSPEVLENLANYLRAFEDGLWGKEAA